MEHAPESSAHRARGIERVAEGLTRLARVTGELARADSVDSVTKIVTYHMADAVGATIAALALREGDNARVLGLRGLPASEADRWELIPLARPTAATDVIRSGTRLVLVGAEAIRQAYPDIPGVDRGERTVVTLPLRATGRTIGAIHLSLPWAGSPDPIELDVLDVMADTCAQAFERIEASVVARRQTARLEFLAEASIELASSLDLDVTINRVARLAVPRLADWCAIDVIRDGRVHRLAVAHVDPAKVQLAVALQERWPPDPSSPTGAVAVARSGIPELLHEITDEMLVAGCRDPEQLRIARELELRSALLVPLFVRGRVIGVLSWVSSDDQRLYEEDDVRFAEHLARRAATAIDNSELFSQTRAAAEQLQHAVLPQLVGDERWEVSCAYRPSGRAEVGGDFYDAFPLADGRFVAFIGDVMGRGVAAAAAMAAMRAATRAFASLDPDPSVVLQRLDQMVRTYGGDQLVTLAYLLADPSSGTVLVGNAGHPPPSILRRDGAVEQLPFTDGPPLGVSSSLVRGRLSLPFEVGDTLLAFTDGLIERRDEDIDAGLGRLARAVPRLAVPGLSAGVEAVVSAVRDDTYDDDMAAMALRRVGR